MIKTELSSFITRQIGQLISKIEPSNRKILKFLVLPLNKLSMTDDYTTEELLNTLSEYI